MACSSRCHVMCLLFTDVLFPIETCKQALFSGPRMLEWVLYCEDMLCSVFTRGCFSCLVLTGSTGETGTEFVFFGLKVLTNYMSVYGCDKFCIFVSFSSNVWDETRKLNIHSIFTSPGEIPALNLLHIFFASFIDSLNHSACFYISY